MLDSRLIADVQAVERCRLNAYKDSRGFWTVGWGHELPLGHDWTAYAVSQAQADALFDQDLSLAQHQAGNLTEFRRLNTCRENAVTELVFNMGYTHWTGFVKCRHALLNQDWQTAHDELLDSAWALEVQPHGLDTPGRATRLAGYLLSGTY